MKRDTHPKYQEVLFVDSSTGHKFVCGSTLQTEERETFEGKEYPVCRVSVSSASHPFFTGSKQLVDAEGRVDKFRKRYASLKASKPAADEEGDETKDEEKKAPAKKSKKK
ncbi:MAG: type B 50S ribosomal protein L31 [Chlamydiales bacterium]|nr:type B 50S ribosomal protein L31 [Chlamydiia bacterium]MCP5508235.1 type B 50S ribosomal protein L31 [Chlamydiales bacterium]